MAAYVRTFFICVGLCICVGLFLLGPYSFWWLHESGDAALERVVAEQAKGRFVVFGSGVSQDFVDYKLRLYEATRPEIIAIGSSRVMQFRGAWFSQSFLNMGGVAGNLAVLRSTIEAILALGPPRGMIIGLDFWWFLPQWEPEPEKHVPPTSGSYNYSFESLKKPWEWLLQGKIDLAEFFAPFTGLFGKGFRTDRFGIMAQQSDDGFGPDGAWNYTGEITGQKPALDWHFADTLLNVERGIKAFYHSRNDQPGPDPRHVGVLVDILHKLHAAHVQTWLFIPPLAAKVLKAMDPQKYAHLFTLARTLRQKGIEVLDFSDAALLGSGDCEFVDGFHGGEVTCARILRQMALHSPGLLNYVNMKKLDEVIGEWSGNALVPNPQLTAAPEVDFLGMGCRKKTLLEQ